MSRYHVHARLCDSRTRRDELQSGETEDLDEALTLAKELADRGFTSWVYGHQHVVHDPCSVPPGPRYRYDVEIREWAKVAEFDPGGRRVR